MRYLILIPFFALTFRNFQFFPGMALVQEFWFALCLVFLIVVYPIWKWKVHSRFTSFELYILAMILLVPIMSAIPAWREFGQPIIYGLLSQRSSILYAGALLLIHAIRYKYFTLHDVEKSLVFLAWGTLLLYLIMKSFLDPAMFDSYGNGFVIGDGSGQRSFRLPGFFLFFGVYYYAFLGFRKKSVKYYLMASLFFVFLLGESGGRSMTVAMFTAFIFFVFRWGRYTRLFKFIPKMLVVITLILGAAYFAKPDSFSSRAAKFEDAFTVALTGNEVEDASARSRIFQTLIAMPYVAKHPVIGNGNISYQWHDGYKGVLGAYFYPSDIGLIGVLYMFGVVGFLLFLWQYWFAIKAARRLPIRIHTPLLDATKGILLYMAIHSLVTGFFVHYAEISFLFIALLVSIARELRGSGHPSKLIRNETIVK
jgi:hypothetical protein